MIATTALWWKSSFHTASRPYPFSSMGQIRQQSCGSFSATTIVLRPFADSRYTLADLRDDMSSVRTVVANRLRCVKPQPVKMIFRDPVSHVCQKKVSHRQTIVAIKVDGRSPLRACLGKIVIRVLAQVVAVWAEVIVDHVKNYADAVLMSGVDHLAKIVRAAISVKRREKIDSVVAPTDISSELSQRHALKNGNAEVAQARRTHSIAER